MAAPIYNNFDHPVIADDNRNAQTSWENHIRRGSIGGVDLAYPFGSPIRANADGTVWWVKGTGSAGWYAQLRIDGRPGWIIEYYHMSGFYNYNGSNGYAIKAGQLIGESGGSGFGSSRYYAPHLHVHLVINGTRVNLWNYFTDTAGGGVTPIPPDNRDEFDMASLDDLRAIVRAELSDLIGAAGRIENGTTAIHTTVAATESKVDAIGVASVGQLTGFYKHGEMVPGSGDLWIVVFPDGNFRRVRSNSEAVAYKNINGGVRATALGAADIQRLVSDLTAAGGRDLASAN